MLHGFPSIKNVLSTARHGQQVAIHMPLGISSRHCFLCTLMARWAGVESFPSRVSSTTLSLQLQGGEAGSKGMQWRPTSITPPKKQPFRHAFFLTFRVHQVTEICNRRYPNSAGKIVRPSHKPFANAFAAPLHALVSSIEQHFSFMRFQGYSILSLKHGLLGDPHMSLEYFCFQAAAAPSTPRRGPASAYPAPASPTPTVASPSQRQLSAAQRSAACREIGLFLRRCLAGEHRDSSGRHRIPLPSRFWAVLRDFEGNDLRPCVVVSRWATALNCASEALTWAIRFALPVRTC